MPPVPTLSKPTLTTCNLSAQQSITQVNKPSFNTNLPFKYSPFVILVTNICSTNLLNKQSNLYPGTAKPLNLHNSPNQGRHCSTEQLPAFHSSPSTCSPHYKEPVLPASAPGKLTSLSGNLSTQLTTKQVNLLCYNNKLLTKYLLFANQANINYFL